MTALQLYDTRRLVAVVIKRPPAAGEVLTNKLLALDELVVMLVVAFLERLKKPWGTVDATK